MTSQMILYIPEQCAVQTLSTSDQRFLFGYTPTGTKGTIFSAGKMLHMNLPGITQVYQGVKSYRGITVDMWSSCQYWQAYDATMTVNWYWSGKFSTPFYWMCKVPCMKSCVFLAFRHICSFFLMFGNSNACI